LAQPVEYVETTGKSFAAALGCPGDAATTAACLRAKSTGELLAVDSWSYEADIVWGGPLLPEAPAAAIAGGRFAHVPMLFGFTENEVRSGAAFLYPMTQSDYAANLSDAFGGHASEVMSVYPSSSYPDPFYAFADAVDDSGIAGPGSCLLLEDANTFSSRVPTYVYEFDDQTAPNPSWISAGGPGFVDGASHGSDEEYWFDRPGDPIVPLNGAQRGLAHQMIQFLGAFLEHGAPSSGWQQSWPRYDAAHQRVMRFRLWASGVTTSLASDNHCAFWHSLGL
jgi:para-nitrobenzyl esterase